MFNFFFFVQWNPSPTKNYISKSEGGGGGIKLFPIDTAGASFDEEKNKLKTKWRQQMYSFLIVRYQAIEKKDSYFCVNYWYFSFEFTVLAMMKWPIT